MQSARSLLITRSGGFFRVGPAVRKDGVWEYERPWRPTLATSVGSARRAVTMWCRRCGIAPDQVIGIEHIEGDHD